MWSLWCPTRVASVTLITSEDGPKKQISGQLRSFGLREPAIGHVDPRRRGMPFDQGGPPSIRPIQPASSYEGGGGQAACSSRKKGARKLEDKISMGCETDPATFALKPEELTPRSSLTNDDRDADEDVLRLGRLDHRPHPATHPVPPRSWTELALFGCLPPRRKNKRAPPSLANAEPKFWLWV